jgi:hypothetical protein
VIWALVITGLMFAESGKLAYTQSVLAFGSERDCESARVIVRDEMLKNNPTSRILIGCVGLEKPKRS